MGVWLEAHRIQLRLDMNEVVSPNFLLGIDMDNNSDFTKLSTVFYFALCILFSLRCLVLDMTEHTFFFIPFELFTILISGAGAFYISTSLNDK